MSGQSPELTVNSIFFSDDYPKEFADIFDEHRCPTNPTIYINMTSKVTPSDAPSGSENWFVLVNAPYLTGQEWEAETVRVRATILRRKRSPWLGNAPIDPLWQDCE